jgi:hypothetical protein
MVRCTHQILLWNGGWFSEEGNIWLPHPSGLQQKLVLQKFFNKDIEILYRQENL